jgi:hypothetical protein
MFKYGLITCHKNSVFDFAATTQLLLLLFKDQKGFQNYPSNMFFISLGVSTVETNQDRDRDFSICQDQLLKTVENVHRVETYSLPVSRLTLCQCRD